MKTYVTPILSVKFVDNADVLTVSNKGAGAAEDMVNINIYG